MFRRSKYFSAPRQHQPTAWIAFWLASILLAIVVPGNKATELVFRVGASVGKDGVCAPLYEQTIHGYEYFFKWLARQPPQVVSDSSGRNYTLRMEYTLVSHNCTEPGRAAALDSLLKGRPADPARGDPGQLPVHVLFGGNGENAQGDAIQADAASRVLLHCCTARDSVYMLDLPHVYGIFTPASMYTGAILRTMAFSGVQRLAVVYTTESALHLQLCGGALRQMPPLAELRHGFGPVVVVNYTSKDVAQPGFWDSIAERVVQSGADTLIACDEMRYTSKLVQAVRAEGHRLSALWLASYGNVSDFLSYLGDAGEYALTTVQWMPSLPYADPAFGTAAEFAADFSVATGLEASYFSAAATATGYVLLTVLKNAIALCDLSGLPALTADAFMWAEGALTCVRSNRSVQYSHVSGQQVVRYTLDQLHLDTFFGPVGFNNYRQNIAPSVVVQVLGGKLKVVVPLDLAEQRLVLPIPTPQPSRTPWPATTAGIVIITLVCVLGAACLVLLAMLAHRWLRPRLNLVMEVEIDPAEVQVDVAPVRNMDGTFEPGEGMYRGTRVKLVVATELISAQSSISAGQLLPAVLSKAPTLPSPLISNCPPPTPLALSSMMASGAGTGGAMTANCLRSPQLGSLAAAREASNASVIGRVCDIVARRQVDSCSEQPSTPRRSLSEGLQGGGFSRRARKQISVMVWRAVRLQHPNICPILGIAWEWPGLLEGGGTVPVIVRQWYELGTLAQLVDNETVPLPLMTKANIAQGIAEGLAYLHAQDPPIVAGPLQPARIVIDKHFNPHIFLRLRNLDPGQRVGPPAWAAHAAGAPPGRMSSRHLPGLSPITSGSGALRTPARTPAGTAMGYAPPAPQPSVSTTLSPLGGGTAAATPGSWRSSFFGGNASGGCGGGASCSGYMIRPLRSIAAAFGCGGGAPARAAAAAAAAAQHVVFIDASAPEPAENLNPFFEPGALNPRVLAEPLCVPPYAGDSTAAATAAANGSSMPYNLSKAQDVYEFGRILGTIFVSPSGSNSYGGRSNESKGIATDLIDRLLDAGGGVGGGGASATTPRAASGGCGDVTTGAGSLAAASSSPFRRQAAEPRDCGDGGGRGGGGFIAGRSSWQVDDADRPSAQQLHRSDTDEALMVQALESICPDIADLARRCLHPDPAERPSFTAIVTILERRIKLALSEGLGLAGVSRTNRMGMHAVRHHLGNPESDSATHSRVLPLMGGAGGGSGPAAAATPRASEDRTATDGGGCRRRSLMLARTAMQASAAGLVAARRSESFRMPSKAAPPEWATNVRRHIVAADDLLFDLFPPKVAHALCAGETVQPERYDCVSIFFSDVVGYTDLCSQLQPYEVMDLMHRLYSQFDAIIQSLRLFKVETVGDAYLAVSNLRWPQPTNHARLIAQFAFAAVRAANRLPVHPDRPELGRVRIRVGLHCGPVVGSVVGTLNRRYCLFGDAVNTAARMEHNSEADRVHCSGAFAALVTEQWPEAVLTSRGVRPIKGKGPMETFWMEAPDVMEEIDGFCSPDGLPLIEIRQAGRASRPPSNPGDGRLRTTPDDPRVIRGGTAADDKSRFAIELVPPTPSTPPAAAAAAVPAVL